MTWKLMCAALVTAPLLTSCVSTGADNACTWAAPILIGDEDVLSDETARQILAHNITGQRLGCWD